MVRQPIVWAEGEDIAQIFRENAANSATNGAAVALLLSLKELYGSGEFSSAKVAGTMPLSHNNNLTGATETLREALYAMRSKDPTSDVSVGRALHSIVNRRVETPKGELVLKRRPLNGLARYSVV
jgi:hypothetical protein